METEGGGERERWFEFIFLQQHNFFLNDKVQRYEQAVGQITCAQKVSIYIYIYIHIYIYIYTFFKI